MNYLNSLEQHRNKILTMLIGISIFFIRLPPMYFLSLSSSLFTTHSLVRLCIVLASILILLFPDKKSNFITRSSVFMLMIIYFFSQSLSIIFAANTLAFLNLYKDIIFTVLLFFVMVLSVNKKDLEFYSKILIFATILNLIWQLVAYFFPQYIFDYLKSIFYEKYWQFFEYQWQRNRFFGDSFDEILLPIILLFFLQDKKNSYKLVYLILIIAIIFIAFISNWRTKNLMLIFSLVASGIIYWKHIKKYLLVLITTILITIFLSNTVSLYTTGQNIIDRFIFNNNELDFIMTGRISFWKDAFIMGLSSPLFGVGLGNYYDYLTQKTQLTVQSSITNRVQNFITVDDPHNIFLSTFAASGVVGVVSLGLLLGFFVIQDLRALKNLNQFVNPIIISFWGLFIFAFLNPWMYFSYLSFFFSLRALLEVAKSK